MTQKLLKYHWIPNGEPLNIFFERKFQENGGQLSLDDFNRYVDTVYPQGSLERGTICMTLGPIPIENAIAYEEKEDVVYHPVKNPVG